MARAGIEPATGTAAKVGIGVGSAVVIGVAAGVTIYATSGPSDDYRRGWAAGAPLHQDWLLQGRQDPAGDCFNMATLMENSGGGDGGTNAEWFKGCEQGERSGADLPD